MEKNEENCTITNSLNVVPMKGEMITFHYFLFLNEKE